MYALSLHKSSVVRQPEAGNRVSGKHCVFTGCVALLFQNQEVLEAFELLGAEFDEISEPFVIAFIIITKGITF